MGTQNSIRAPLHLMDDKKLQGHCPFVTNNKKNSIVDSPPGQIEMDVVVVVLGTTKIVLSHKNMSICAVNGT